MVCASEGKVNSLDTLLQFKPDLELRDTSGRTALHFACRAGNIEVVKRLLQLKQIDLDSQTNGGVTPLMCAVESGNIEVVEECLNCGCNPLIADGLGTTALDLAKKYRFSTGTPTNIWTVLETARNGFKQIKSVSKARHFIDFKP
jgi:ankyrin repeat protein